MTLTDRSNSRTGKERKDNRTSTSSIRCPGPPSVHDAQMIPYHSLGSPSVCELTSLLDDDSDQSETQSLHQSIIQRRRHAVYYHRPPVCVPLQRPDVNTFPMKSNTVSRYLLQGFKDRECCGCCQFRAYKEQWCGRCPENKDLTANVDSYLPRSVSEIGIGGYEEQLKFLDTNWVEEPFIVAMANVENGEDGDRPQLVIDDTLPEICTEPEWGNFVRKQDSGGEKSAKSVMRSLGMDVPERPEGPEQSPAIDESQEGTKIARTFSQIIADDCTRLRSYKDIRLGPDEGWAIREGSLVICLDPSYTDIEPGERPRDEFELVHGDIYVICRMYGDMWALCAKLTFQSPIEPSSTKAKHGATPKSFEGLGFLPLCALTLAANFSPFIRRCAEYGKCPQEEPRFPGNGHRVTPPDRSHSLNASREIFEKSLPKQLQLPNIVFEVCSGSSLEEEGKEFVPLDHPPQETSKMGSVWKSRSGQPERRMTLKKMWHKLKISDSSVPAEPIAESQQQATPLPPLRRAISMQRSIEAADQAKPPESTERPQTSDGNKTASVIIQPGGHQKRRKSVRDLLFSTDRLKRSSDRGSGQSEGSMSKGDTEQHEHS